VAGTCECGNEISVSIKSQEFFDSLRTCWLLKKDSASCSKYIFVFCYDSDNKESVFPSAPLTFAITQEATNCLRVLFAHCIQFRRI